MPAGPEHDQQPLPDRPGLRAAWLGSRRAAVTAAVVAVGVLAGAGVAVAATGSSSPTPAPSASAVPPGHATPPKAGPWRMMHPGGPMPFGPAGPGMLGGLFGGLFGAVHGTAVVPKPSGGYQTVAFQNGKVTAASGTSITLHSADGYSRTYQVTSATMVNAQRDGIGSIKAGHQVIVTATVGGSTATAVRIIDATLLQQGLHRFFGAAPGANVKMAIP